MSLIAVLLVCLGLQTYTLVNCSQAPSSCSNARQNSQAFYQRISRDIDDVARLVRELLQSNELRDSEAALEYNKTVARFGVTSINNATSCLSCDTRNFNQYEKCLREENNNLTTSLNHLQTSYRSLREAFKDFKADNRKGFTGNLNVLVENLLEFLIPVKIVERYYTEKLEIFHKSYVQTKRISQNYIITNDVFITGKSLRTSFNAILKTYGCGIEKGLQAVLAVIEQVITPFNASKYPLPSLRGFAMSYGVLVENKGILALIRSYDYIFAQAEEFRLKELRTTGSSGPSISLRNALAPVADLLKNSTCRNDRRNANELLRCIVAARNASLDMPTLRFMVERCYADYSMQNYCYTTPNVKQEDKYKELTLCISLALKSSDEKYMDCCFKYFE